MDENLKNSTLSANMSKTVGLDVYDYYTLESDGNEIRYLYGPIGSVKSAKRDIATNSNSNPRIIGILKSIAERDADRCPTAFIYEKLDLASAEKVRVALMDSGKLKGLQRYVSSRQDNKQRAQDE